MKLGKPNYYEVLGVSRTATQQEIRKRYHELVRKYHPDVNPDKELGHRMLIKILDAYHVLGNADSRKKYDLQLDQQTQPVSRSSAPPSAPRTTANRASKAQRRVTSPEAERFVSDARLDFLMGNLNSAANNCKKAIHLFPRHAQAHVILGDILHAQGRSDEAMSHYTLAYQFSPYEKQRAEINKRMTRLLQDEKEQAEKKANPNIVKKEDLRKVSTWAFGGAASVAGALFLGIFPGHAVWPSITLVSEWTSNMLVVMSLISILLGSLLSLTRTARRADEELIFSTIRVLPGGHARSFGITIILITLIWYYLGFIVYLIVAGNNETLSSSILKAYGIAFLATALVSAAIPAAAGQLFLFGSNISFGFVLLGWVIGDLFRPLHD